MMESLYTQLEYKHPHRCSHILECQLEVQVLNLWSSLNATAELPAFVARVRMSSSKISFSVSHRDACYLSFYNSFWLKRQILLDSRYLIGIIRKDVETGEPLLTHMMFFGDQENLNDFAVMC